MKTMPNEDRPYNCQQQNQEQYHLFEIDIPAIDGPEYRLEGFESDYNIYCVSNMTTNLL
jgi:hypothetical protein